MIVLAANWEMTDAFSAMPPGLTVRRASYDPPATAALLYQRMAYGGVNRRFTLSANWNGSWEARGISTLEKTIGS